jgi:type I restriction enzyme S subunit
VDIYDSLIENMQSYESGLNDLKLVCDGYIEDLKKNLPLVTLGQYITSKKIKNTGNLNRNFVGIYGDEFRVSREITSREDLSTYQIIKDGDIVYPPPHFGNIGTIALWRGEDCVTSPMYVSFHVNDEKIL